MSRLEELRQQVAEMFKDATDKVQIEQLAAINNSIDEVNREQQSLMDKNAELIKSYKDLVQHTSFKDHIANDSVPGTHEVSFEEALDNFLAKK